VNITRKSKDWWNEDYQAKLTAYRSSKRVKEWKDFKKNGEDSKTYLF